MWPIINDVETGKTPEYPDIQPQDFAFGPEAVFDACLRVARTMPRWHVTVVADDGKRIEAVYTTLILRFKDDITIRVEASDEGSRVRVRSRSRVGKGDLGQNARTIRAFQQALAETLA